MKKQKNVLVKLLSSKVLSMVVAMLFVLSVAVPSFAENNNATKTNAGSNILQENGWSTKVTVAEKGKRVTDLKKIGKNYYAIVKDNGKNVYVKINKQIYNSLKKAKKNGQVITLQYGAKAKKNSKGNLVVSSAKSISVYDNTSLPVASQKYTTKDGTTVTKKAWIDAEGKQHETVSRVKWTKDKNGQKVRTSTYTHKVIENGKVVSKSTTKQTLKVSKNGKVTGTKTVVKKDKNGTTKTVYKVSGTRKVTKTKGNKKTVYNLTLTDNKTGEKTKVYTESNQNKNGTSTYVRKVNGKVVKTSRDDGNGILNETITKGNGEKTNFFVEQSRRGNFSTILSAEKLNNFSNAKNLTSLTVINNNYYAVVKDNGKSVYVKIDKKIYNMLKEITNNKDSKVTLQYKDSKVKKSNGMYVVSDVDSINVYKNNVISSKYLFEELKK